MRVTPADQLRSEARTAAARGDWGVVYSSLQGIDAPALAPADLELLADAAWWLARLDESLTLRQRTYAAFVAADDARRAAFSAWFLWFDYRFKGDVAIASGWLTRAGRHVADLGDCYESAFVTLALAESARGEGDLRTSQLLATEALEVGRALRNADIVAMATMNLGECAITEGRTQEGVARFDDAMCSVIAGELTPLFMGLVFCGVLSACFEIADLRRAAEWTSAAVAWCESIPSGSPYHGICRVHRVEVSTLQGDWVEAETQAVRASEELLALEPAAASEAFYAIGEIRRRRGDLSGAEAAFVRAHQLGRSPQPGLSLLRLRQDRVADATALLRIAPDALPRAPLPRAIVHAAQVEVALACGDAAGAQAACAALEALATVAPNTVIDALATLGRASVLLATADAERALDHAARACARFRELRLPHEAALAQIVHGLAARATGDADGARLELEAACRALIELGARTDVERVSILLEETERDRPCGLTAREVEVLRLVAAGKTNREIAREMYLSEHTVSRHLQNMFAKLDVSSRAAATAFAYEHELV